MSLWLYVFLCCNRACVYICDCDVICVGHDLNRSVLWVVVSLQCKCLIVWVRGRHLGERQF